MGSKLLPQALISLPTSLRLSQSLFPQKLGFSAELVSRRLSPISASFSFVSRVSTSQFGLVIISDSDRQRLSVVRAGEESEAETSERESPQEEAPPAEDGESVTAEDSEAEAEPRPPRKPRVKMGEIMGILNQRAIEASQSTRPVPDLRTGDVVEIKLQVSQNRRRLATYKGIVISKQNAGIHTTIRIRRIIAGIAVEIVFPVYSPNIKEIKVMAHRKVRKARLYYLRDKLPRFSTFK